MEGRSSVALFGVDGKLLTCDSLSPARAVVDAGELVLHAGAWGEAECPAELVCCALCRMCQGRECVALPVTPSPPPAASQDIPEGALPHGGGAYCYETSEACLQGPNVRLPP